MRVLVVAGLVAGMLLTACGGGDVDGSPPSAGNSVQSPSTKPPPLTSDLDPQSPDLSEASRGSDESDGPAGVSASAVEAACKLFVRPDAPRPPAVKPESKDLESLQVWIEFFESSETYYAEIESDFNAAIATPELLDGISGQDPAAMDAAFDLTNNFRLLKLAFETDGEFKGKVVAYDIEAFWRVANRAMEKMCPQWDPAQWPYEG